jgi:GDSL-like lipase/acylhydrolase family protein
LFRGGRRWRRLDAMHGRTSEQTSAVRARPSARFFRQKPRKTLRFVLLANLLIFCAMALVGEVGFRLFWNPKYWIQCENWVVGCGQTSAGKKWWPDATYRIESREFRVRFRTNHLGYRARPQAPRTARPLRIAFVGDSFTEGMQVEYERTFCALIERELADSLPGSEVVCENFGVAATGIFDYWHRITHDVLTPVAPDAVVLCLYPGNDFTDAFPDDGFEPDGRPRRSYYREPNPAWHVVTWWNLKSKVAHYVTRSMCVAALRFAPRTVQGPWLWWADPELAARSAGAPAIERSKVLLHTISYECRKHGTKLCLLVVGPVPNYRAKDGQSPLGRIIADWNIDVPVVDAAIAAAATPHFERLLFPRDGHLNESGHAFMAASALPALRSILPLAAKAALARESRQAQRATVLIR